MKTILILAGFLLVSGVAHAEHYIKYSGDTYLGCFRTGNTNDYLLDPDEYDNPKPGFFHSYTRCQDITIPEKYRKVSGGNTVVEMIQAEKDAVDQAEAAAQDASLRASAKEEYDGQTTQGQVLRALVEVMLTEINILRINLDALSKESNQLTDLNLPARTLAQAKAAIKKAIEDGDVDE